MDLSLSVSIKDRTVVGTSNKIERMPLTYTTRILLIHDGKFSSRITEKPSVNNICDGFRNHHGLSIMD